MIGGERGCELERKRLPKVVEWREMKKNRVKVALSTENPPQIHCTKSIPINEMAENKLVIIVPPPKDIWSHGKT